MNSAPQRGIAFTATSGPNSVKAKLSYQLPSHQYFEVEEKGTRARFIQTSDRIAYFQDFDQTYYEYRSHGPLIGPPPESGLVKDLYPVFLWSWLNIESFKNATADGAEKLDGIEVDWIKQIFPGEGVDITIRTAITKEGSPKRVIFSDPNSATITFNFEQFTWPFFDVKAWKYQPPIGYMLGNAPKAHFPLQFGQKIDFKSWGINVANLNKKGVAVIITAADSKPDQAILPALQEMQKALDKIGVKTVEVHLDATQAPKRNWPVTLDTNGTIADQLDIPVTPYIYFVNQDNMILKAWAGYGEDQRKKLVKTAVEAFNSSEDE